MRKSVIIGGGTGSVGEGIVRAFLKAEYQVLVPSRSEKNLNQLAELVAGEGGEFVPLELDITKPEAARKAVLAHTKNVDALVASLGGWWQGSPLIDVTPETWHSVIDMGLTAHYHFARTFVPLLNQGAESSYTFINGSAIEEAYPNMSLVSISAAAQLMLAQSQMVELKNKHRVNVLVLGPVLTRTRPGDASKYVSADGVGHASVTLAENPKADAGIYKLYTASDMQQAFPV